MALIKIVAKPEYAVEVPAKLDFECILQWLRRPN
jgi:hypothetical protein